MQIRINRIELHKKRDLFMKVADSLIIFAIQT